MAGFLVVINLSARNELQDARIKDDDWTGKTDQIERRKRQNRLHQRAWRRRKALEHASATQPSLVPAYQTRVGNETVRSPTDGEASLRQLVQGHVRGHQRMPLTFSSPESRDAFWAALSKTLDEPQSIFAYWAELAAYRKLEVMSALSSHNPSLSVQYTPNLYFPLPVDHQLFVLIQHNTLRGAMTNLSILLRLNGRKLEGWADFYLEDLPSAIPSAAPPSLQPTDLQKATPHEAWIDVLSSPTLRDNILQNQDRIDVDALCEDFLGGMEEGLSEVEGRGLILWGDCPWEDGAWEVSEGFARKWAFLLRGCTALLESSNRWREKRGEDRLVLEV